MSYRQDLINVLEAAETYAKTSPYADKERLMDSISVIENLILYGDWTIDTEKRAIVRLNEEDRKSVV